MAGPWFVLAGVLFVVALAALHGMAEAMVAAAALFVFLAACLRALVLEVRDDDVSSMTIRGPAMRTLAIMGADRANKRRGRGTRRTPPR